MTVMMVRRTFAHGRTSPQLSGTSSPTGGRASSSQTHLRPRADEPPALRHIFAHGRTSPQLSDTSSPTGGRAPSSQAHLRPRADEPPAFRHIFALERTSPQLSGESSPLVRAEKLQPKEISPVNSPAFTRPDAGKNYFCSYKSNLLYENSFPEPGRCCLAPAPL